MVGAAMSKEWARAMLSIYRWGGALAYPAIGGYLAIRTSRAKKNAAATRTLWQQQDRTACRTAGLDSCRKRRRNLSRYSAA